MLSLEEQEQIYKDGYNNAPAEVQKKMDDEAISYGFNPIASDTPKDTVLKNLTVRVINKIIRSVKARFQFIELLTHMNWKNGATDVDYKFTKQLRSMLNTMKPEAGFTGFEDVTLESFTGAFLEVYRETYQCDFNASNKFSIPSAILNAVYNNQAQFMAVVNSIAELATIPIEILNYQRALQYLDETDYDITLTLPFGYLEIDEAGKGEQLAFNLKKLIQQIQSISLKFDASASYKILKSKPKDSTKAPLYGGANIKRLFYINNDLETKINTFVKSGAYQLGKLDLPKSMKKIVISTDSMSEWRKSWKVDPKKIVAYLIDTGAAVMGHHYKGTVIKGTTRVFHTVNYYDKTGLLRLKDKFQGIIIQEIIKPNLKGEALKEYNRTIKISYSKRMDPKNLITKSVIIDQQEILKIDVKTTKKINEQTETIKKLTNRIEKLTIKK